MVSVNDIKKTTEVLRGSFLGKEGSLIRFISNIYTEIGKLGVMT